MSAKIDGSAFRAGGGTDPPLGVNAMKLRISRSLAVAAVAVVSILGGAQTLAQNAYITNALDNTVSVIDTTTNTVTATFPVGAGPSGVAVTSDGSKVYVTNGGSNTVSVIDTAT